MHHLALAAWLSATSNAGASESPCDLQRAFHEHTIEFQSVMLNVQSLWAMMPERESAFSAALDRYSSEGEPDTSLPEFDVVWSRWYPLPQATADGSGAACFPILNRDALWGGQLRGHYHGTLGEAVQLASVSYRYDFVSRRNEQGDAGLGLFLRLWWFQDNFDEAWASFVEMAGRYANNEAVVSFVGERALETLRRDITPSREARELALRWLRALWKGSSADFHVLSQSLVQPDGVEIDPYYAWGPEQSFFYRRWLSGREDLVTLYRFYMVRAARELGDDMLFRQWSPAVRAELHRATRLARRQEYEQLLSK